MKTKELGNLGESFACEYLLMEGYKIVCRNYRCRYGEMDIIACKNKYLYFVEIKTRRSIRFGTPAEAVGREKQMHMKRVAADFLRQHDYRGYSVEFKVIEILINEIDNVII
ncbi:MAG: YraN family protein [Eubacteriaceae bacterium]|nr:YraN family protein [Eubacteriaceae bacterium]